MFAINLRIKRMSDEGRFGMSLITPQPDIISNSCIQIYIAATLIQTINTHATGMPRGRDSSTLTNRMK